TGGNYNTDEDTAVALTGLTGALTDTDGSETLTYRVTGVDPAASFTTGTDAGGGVWTFTKAELDAGLTYNPPPQADGTFNMVLEATATEDEGDTASNTANIIVTVAPILDAPNLVAGSSSANEDTVIALGSDIDLTIDDLDGSQTLTVVLDGIPAASITSFNGGLPGTVTQTGPEQWTFTGTAAETNALLDSFTVQPPADTDDNFIVAVSATTVENGGATATSNANHTVTISAVADAPNLSQIAAATGDEDTVIDIPITVGLNDTDGSETLDFVLISGVPASATFAIATTGSAVAVDEGGGVWRVTGLTADIVSTLATGVTILPGANLGDDIPLTVTAQSIESNPTPGGEIAVLTAQTVLPIVVDVIPIADVVSSTGGSYAGEEDTNIALTGLAGSSIDTDGSEVVTFEIQSVPIGASFVDAGGNPVGVNAGGGVWEFTAAQIAAGISFTPPFNTHGTYNLILEATTTELGNPASSQVSTAPIEIVVDAQADRPNITGNSNGLEDTAINFGASYNVSLFDTDGSESLTSITIELQGGQTATFVETSGATVAVSGTTYTITGPEAGLQDTLDTFSLTPPAQSDVDIPVRIIATTEDADGSTNSRTSNRNIRVRAVADTPDGTANNISGQEDMAIVLNLMAIDSVDTDGSEILSVRLFDLPAGSVVGGSTAGGVEYMRSGNDWIVTAPDTATLNAALSSATYTPPNDFSGVVSASMEVISTESATGNQVAVPTASVVRTFDITVAQVADAPELRVTNATEGAAGLEDTPIRLVVDIRAGDDDGSESITNITISDIPAGATIVDAAGNPLGALQGDGTVILTGAELPQLHVLAPADSNDDFQLSIAATATENPQGLPGDGDAEIGTATIDVAVIGVADPANITVAPIISDEDNAIPIGAAITGGLSDTDGSESLFYVLTGLPAGIIPSVGTFIGSGWQISATDMASLTIQPPANFSGDYIAEIAPALQIRAITQENDGDQTSVTVPLSIIVNPVVDAQSWNPSAQVLEDNDIPLSGAAPAGLVDDDGSEQIVSYTFNLSNIVAAAGIGATVTDTADFIANFINGTFTDNLDGTITVLPGNLSGVSFDATAFPDSNRDFGVPLAVEFSDTAGGTVVTSVVNDVFAVDLVGDADLPTVFADDYTGDDNTIFALNPTGIEFGGTTSDVDVANGQAQSETIYYIVSGLRDPGTPILAFVDSAGDPIGLNNQDGTWLLTPAEIADLNVITPSGESGTANLTLTTVATENDGDQATNATTFTIDITANGVSGTPIEPLPPIVTVSPMTVGEDGTQVVLVDVQPDPADPSTSTPSIAVVLTGIPADATVTGAFFNPTNNTWVTDAATISAGNVTIAPAADYSGPIDFTVTATATNNEQQQASASNVPVNIDVAPVADGPAIALTSPGGGEDSAIDLNIGLSLQDTNGLVPEQIQDPVVITIPVGASLSAGTNTGGGVWELTQAELAGLQITPAADDDTDISVTVQATSVEPANGDTRTTTENLTIPVTAAADAAIVTVADSTGDEDTAITLTGLSATLSDTDGSEVLSTTLSGVPEGTILSAGSNNGDGTWTIDPADWAGLTLTPPMNYSGTIALELVAFTLESTGQTSETREAFTVTVDPVADGVVFTALPQSGDAGAPIALNLDLSPGDETGNAAGENPSELITVVLTGAVDFVATSTGGSLVKTGANEWTFSGTAAEGNSLAVTSFGDTTDFDLGVLINATDGASVGAAVAATIPITVTNAGGNFTGTVASETLTGGAGADLIAGGGGSDILTGGAGADLFTWAVGDTAGGATDTVTDFALGTDVLDLSELISAFDPATDVISDFISLSESGGDTTVQISPTGTGGPLDDVVELTGVSGTDLASLIAAGSLVV
ncbi:type I secretion C-terminal target domain-containing protein, partial [Ahrensia sp. R2A130]|uniref:type I secretion C-terminal target domain-containing protein n=1 Tax=Ahrensia sp. R2A130 TaxID=744979 RepID=UPI0001E0E902